MPAPFDLPMPYFICNRCTPAGAVMTNVRHLPDGTEECELGVASLKRAADFYARNVGREQADYQQIVDAIDARKNDPWKGLPLAVRNRLENWYRPHEGERFVCYIPDHDFAKAEAGMGGLVLSDKRMVYRKFSAQAEIRLDERVEVHAENTPDHYTVRIGRPGEKPMALHCDPSALEVIRQTLRRVGAQYTYRT
jgi:hypothetical protein